jgi:MFS family permease
LLAGALIDRIGARWVILSGVGFIGLPLILMNWMTRFWQYELLCVAEVLGYTLAGPIANQVLISRWFRVRRGRAMGYAYLGLGLGGVVSPPLANLLIRNFGWRHALEITGALILIVLFPVGFWITRSVPAEMGLTPDGALPESSENGDSAGSSGISAAVRTANFWLILVGAALVIGAINAVIQHFILFMKDQGSCRFCLHRV